MNIDNIPSIRRNPIICDLFSRLKLMERRGSGLRNIIDQYPEDVMLSFHSTEQTFVMTLKNLNYAKLSTPYGDDVGVDNGDNNNFNLILNAISEDQKITQKNIALKTGLSTRIVSREIRELCDTGVIRYVGSDRSDYRDQLLPDFNPSLP